MVKRPGLSFKTRGCPRCGGDAYLEAAADEPEWRCLQCGRAIPLVAARPELQPAYVRVTPT